MMPVEHMSWLERHVEKLFAAAAGSVLLFVVISQIVLRPHTVEVAGERLGPREFYTLVDSTIKDRRLIMQNAEPITDQISTSSLPDLESPRVQVSSQLIPPFVPLNPPLPKLPEFSAPTSDISVARILAPTKPFGSTGKAAARIPPARETSITRVSTSGNEEGFAFTRDWHWVALAATISREAQREVFVEAGYDTAGMDLVVVEVEAERQERLPDGDWGRPEIVKPYLPLRMVVPHQLQLYKGDSGYELSTRDRDCIVACRQRLMSSEAQARLLRFPFQNYLADSNSRQDQRAQWSVPRALKASNGIELDMTDPTYGLFFLPEKTSLRVVFFQLNAARDTLNQGWKEAGLRPYLDAVSLLSSIVADQTTSLALRRSASGLLDEYRHDIKLAAEIEEIERSRADSTATTRLGPGIEPVWITDTTVEPGKTYRYRIRLLTLNRYAGVTSRLADPMDAGRVIIEGEWSPWSDKITVPPTQYLFVVAPEDESRKTVRIRVYQWSGGIWDNGFATVTVGDRIVIEKGLSQLTYDGIVKDIDFHRAYVDSDRQDGNRTTGSSTETVALTLVNSKGETEERFAARDRQLMNALIREIREEERRQRDIDPQVQVASPSRGSGADIGQMPLVRRR